MAFFSTTLTVATTAKPLFTSLQGINKITQLQISLQTLGATSTYVAIGGSNSQDRKLTAVGEGIGIDTPNGKLYIDPRSLFIVSDSGTAIVEIIGDTYK
jgi:hypothetical protein